MIFICINNLRTSDDLVANQTYRKLFASAKDLRYVDQVLLQFNKKGKPFFGADPNAPQVLIDKIKIKNSEVENEV